MQKNPIHFEIILHLRSARVQWKPTLLSSPPGWLPNWTSATKVQICLTHNTSDIGEVIEVFPTGSPTKQSQEGQILQHFSPSQWQGTLSSEVGHHGIHVIQLGRWFILRTLQLQATSKCSKCQTVQKQIEKKII